MKINDTSADILVRQQLYHVLRTPPALMFPVVARALLAYLLACPASLLQPVFLRSIMRVAVRIMSAPKIVLGPMFSVAALVSPGFLVLLLPPLLLQDSIIRHAKLYHAPTTAWD